MKQINHIAIFIFVCLQLTFPQSIQSDSSLTHKPDTIAIRGVDWLAYPYIFYSPETSLAFGGGGIVYFKLYENPKAKSSSITPSFYYTVNGQYDVTIIPELFLFEDKLKIWSKLNYSSYFDRYYGIGNQSVEIENDKYLQDNFQAQIKLQPKLFDDRLNIGINYEIRNMSVVDTKGNPYLENDSTIIGKEGGLTSGLGFAVSWDTRDNNFFPSRGGYYEAYTSNFFEFIGSDFNYNKSVLDLRHYWNPIFSHVVALQAYLLNESGTPPFYDLGLLGGSRLMRGTIMGRYRDKTYYVVQSEYRMPELVWRFGLILFAGFGDVAPSLKRITISNVKPTYGFGIRFRFDELEKVEIRMDVGFGKGSNGIYFDINQAF
ncbi:MAG: BamA/TamA family outer membrane protein [Ignavibacteriaceae bacterium]|nr:BamA/TamA family outer membrane protein [Ignavibacteriaceae bacterium]